MFKGGAHKLKKVFITSDIIYGVLALVSIIFLFNNFTSSAETNFIFRIISVAIIYFVGTFPLLIATSDNIDPPTWAKVLLFIGYVVLEACALFFAYKTFGDKTFMFNINLSKEAFKNSQNNFTSVLWIILLFSSIALIPILSVKMWKMWDDWTYFLLIPFAPAIAGIAVAAVGILIICGILKAIGSSSSSSTSDSYSEDYDTDSDSVSDDSVSDESESDSESQETRHSYLRFPGERFYDGNGILRDPGERYYDGGGILRDPDERYYDGQGILRDPGERYYDGEGILRDPGDNYYDGGY